MPPKSLIRRASVQPVSSKPLRRTATTATHISHGGGPAPFERSASQANMSASYANSQYVATNVEESFKVKFIREGDTYARLGVVKRSMKYVEFVALAAGKCDFVGQSLQLSYKDADGDEVLLDQDEYDRLAAAVDGGSQECLKVNVKLNAAATPMKQQQREEIPSSAIKTAPAVYADPTQLSKPPATNTSPGPNAAPQAAVPAPLMPSSSYKDYKDLVAQGNKIEWTRTRLLGRGAYGSVYEGLTSEGKLVAVKVMELPDTDDDATLEDYTNKLMREVNVMRILKHKNCVAYYGCQLVRHEREGRQVQIFLEHCPGGTLAVLCRNQADKGGLSMVLVRLYVRQVLEGLAYLHSKGVIHRDIKPDNVLISATGEAKLADFGCSKKLSQTVMMRTGGSAVGSTSSIESSGGAAHSTFHAEQDRMAMQKGVTNTLVGTPLYMAPEMMLEGDLGYSRPADIWSVGCLLLEMLGRKPWPINDKVNMFQVLYKISNSVGLPPGVPAKCPPALRAFFEKCFERDPASRDSAAGLLRHPWIVCKDSELEEVPKD
jgi:serine/threonine protein kinase